MRCVVESVLDGYALLQPTHGFKTNVYCYAKRSLRKGDALDGLGGYACYGLIENCKDNQERPGFPICLAEDVTVTRDIMKDEKIYTDDVDYNPQRPDISLYSMAVEREPTRLHSARPKSMR